MSDLGPPLWAERAACSGLDTDIWFPTRYTHETSPENRHKHLRNCAVCLAVRICATCPVIRDCYAYAVSAEHGVGAASRHGVYAGLTPGERWRAERDATNRRTAAEQVSA